MHRGREKNAFTEVNSTELEYQFDEICLLLHTIALLDKSTCHRTGVVHVVWIARVYRQYLPNPGTQRAVRRRTYVRASRVRVFPVC